MATKIKPCKKCGSTKVTLWDCGYSSFNTGGGKCQCGHKVKGEAGCSPTQDDLAGIWNDGQKLTKEEKLLAENKLLRAKVRSLSKSNTQPQAREALPPTTGSSLFAELCETLIEDGEHYLAPEIGRTRSTDWMAFIFTHHDKDRRERLAVGQADTMDAACAACVADYHERQRIESRKAELLQDPKVNEALQLFGKNPQAQARQASPAATGSPS